MQAIWGYPERAAKKQKTTQKVCPATGTFLSTPPLSAANAKDLVRTQHFGNNKAKLHWSTWRLQYPMLYLTEIMKQIFHEVEEELFLKYKVAIRWKRAPPLRHLPYGK